MQDVINAARYMNKAAYIMMVERELLERKEVFNVADISSKQVIHTHHRIPFGYKPITKMRAKEAGSAGNENAFVQGW